jgi:hypothetical protein
MDVVVMRYEARGGQLVFDVSDGLAIADEGHWCDPG